MSQKCSALDDAEKNTKTKTWQTYNSQTPVVSSWFNKRLRFPNSAPLFVEQVAPQTEQLPAIGHGKFLQWPSHVPGVPTTSTASTTVVKPSRSNLTWRRNWGVDEKLDILDILCSFYGASKACFEVSILRWKGHGRMMKNQCHDKVFFCIETTCKVTPGWLTIVYSIHQIGHPSKFKLEQLPLA